MSWFRSPILDYMRLVQCSLTVRSVSISWDSGTIVCCLSTIVRSVVQFMSLRFRIHSAIYISTIRPIHTSNRTGGGGFSFRVGAQGRYQRLLIVPRWNCFFSLHWMFFDPRDHLLPAEMGGAWCWIYCMSREIGTKIRVIARGDLCVLVCERRRSQIVALQFSVLRLRHVT